MSNVRDPQRLRQGLNPLLTHSLGSPYHGHGTPMSAVSMTPNHLHSAHPPGSAVQPYNPQEWIPSPAAGVERGHHFAEAQGAN